MSRIKISIIIKIIMGIAFLSIFLVYGVFSYLLPDHRYSFQSLFIFSKTHTHNENEEFRYGIYSFKINTTFSDIPYLPRDCSKYGKPNGASRLTKSDCEEENERRKSRSENNKYLALKINIKNNSNKIQTVSRDWFKIVSDRGKTYTMRDSDHFETGDLMPKTERGGTFFGITIEKGEKEFNVIIALPNLAPQIVKIKAR